MVETKCRTEEELLVMKFVVVQSIATELFVAVDEYLEKLFETNLSTTHKERFSVNRVERKKMDRQAPCRSWRQSTSPHVLFACDRRSRADTASRARRRSRW